MLITSPNNEKIKELGKLKQKKYRDKTGRFLVEGMHLIMEAYKSGCLLEVLLEQNEVLPLDIPITYVSNDIITKLSTLETPSTILGICQKKVEQTEDLGDHILALDGIQDPGNLGTIIRSSVAFNVDTLLLSNDTVDLYNPKVIRASQGMIFHLNIIRRDLVPEILTLKEKCYKIYGTKVTHGIDIKQLNNLSKYVLIMGNEGNGIREASEDLCDEFLYINMNEACESLNVGVACSIMLYQLGTR